MNITIIGAGNAGSTVAADLTLKGHTVTLCKTSNALHNEHFNAIKKENLICLEEDGKVYKVRIFNITTNYREAITPCTELVIIYVQTNYHEQIIKEIAPYLCDNQIVLFEPGYLSTAYLLKYIKKEVISVEAESSPIDCRIIQPGRCSVLFRNVKNPIGVYPSKKTDYVLKKLSTLDYNFVPLESVVEASLHNPNLIVHTIGAVMSIPRIEFSKGEYWMYKEVFTPSVWNLVESLDNEKMQILDKLSLKKLPYVEACKERNTLDKSMDAKKAFFDYAYNHSPKGPAVVDSRYITEDVSQGLCLLESLGMVLKVPTPITTALIEMASSMLKRDFRLEGRNIDRLCWDNIMKIIQE